MTSILTRLFDLSGKTALITGSSQGIGYALARGLGEAGATVVLNGLNKERLNGAVEALRQSGISTYGYSFDVADSAAVNQQVIAVQDEVGPIDILVNNAGIQRRSPLESYSESDWRDLMGINLDGVFYVSKAVAPGMLERQAGKIINITSLMSEVGRKTTGPYAASKGGVKMLTKAMATEWGPHNIQVNGIGPGYFATELNRPLLQDVDFTAWVSERTPAGRWGELDELVGVAIFLASAASSYVNGQILYVDGGMLARL